MEVPWPSWPPTTIWWLVGRGRAELTSWPSHKRQTSSAEGDDRDLVRCHDATDTASWAAEHLPERPPQAGGLEGRTVPRPGLRARRDHRRRRRDRRATITSMLAAYAYGGFCVLVW